MYSQLVSIYEAWCSAERQQPRQMSHTQTHGCELVNFAVAGGRGRGQRGGAGGHVARARPLLLDILRGGCAAELDAFAFDVLMGGTTPCNDDGEGQCRNARPELD